MQKKNILVVEDERIVAEEIKKRLQNLGYDVPVVVSKGEDAILKAEEIRPDLILMDILLKGKIDGIKASKQIKELYNIPVIFLTSHSDEKTLEKAKLTEPAGYLIKPVRERELYATAQMAIYKHEMEQKLKRSETKFRSLNSSMSEGVCLHEIIYNKSGKAIDYRIIDVNPAYELIINIKREQAVGSKATELYGEDGLQHLDIYAGVASSKKPTSFEAYFSEIDRYFIISVFSPEKGKFATVFNDITKRKKAEETIKKYAEKLENLVKERTKEIEHEKEKYKSLFEDSNDPIFIISPKTNKIIDCNFQASRILGLSNKECLDKMFHEAYIKEDKNIIIKSLKKVKIERNVNFISFGTLESSQSPICLETNLTLIEYGTEKIIQAICHDISQAKRIEDEIMKKTIKYELDKGHAYLVEEPVLDECLDVFNNLLECGFKGYLFSRTKPEFIKRKIAEDVDIFWLAENKFDKNTISPNIKEMELRIENLLRGNNVILFDRFDYLFSNNCFTDILRFIQRIAEFIYIQKWILLLSIDPRILNKKELNMLKKELLTIKPKQKMELEKNLHSLLKHINKENKSGKMPSINEIANNLKISRDTARKRINLLEIRRLINIIHTGRLKLLEITNKGKENI